MSDSKLDPTDTDFAKVVGERLRKLRRRKQLSLQAVETQSGGKLRAAVVGSYERGDRTASIRRLAELADFYRVPVDALVTAKERVSSSEPFNDDDDDEKVVLDLDALRKAPTDAAYLVNFINGVQQKRNDFGGEVLTIRSNDVWMVSSFYGWTSGELKQKMAEWGVIADQV